MRVPPMQDVVKYLRQVREAALRQQADDSHDAGDGSRGEGAAGEADQVNLVACRIIVGQERVCLAHSLVQSFPNGTCSRRVLAEPKMHQTQNGRGADGSGM
jgi:hypothetical protein